MDKRILIVGVVILVIGIAVAAVGFTGIHHASPSDLDEDYDDEEGKFESYDEGDTVTVTGEITDKSETDELSETDEFLDETYYIYEMDDTDFGFLSSEDIADEGDTITVNLEVQLEVGEMLGYEYEYEYMEAQSVQTIPMMGVVGLIVLIVGGAIAGFGFIKGGKETTERGPGMYQQQPQQPQQQPQQQQQRQPQQQQQQQPQQQQPQQQQPQQQQPQQQPQQQQQQQSACPDCGGQMRFINENNQWYCDRCQQYK